VGRIAEPTHLKVARGTYRPGRDPDPALQPKPEIAQIGEPPEGLGELGAKVWHTLGPRLVKLELLTEIDLAAFTRYCRAHDEIARLDQILREQGEYFHTEQGYVGQHPAVNQRFKWLAELNRFEQRFGMTASDRCGIQLPSKDKGGVSRRRRAE
jgi:P27 family predicted phage terminase small subunit